ncbi:U3 small nucleolar RNA-associated protein MPP10 [Golovinomyces cichoracearum]|uniref:U3 small nucleolar ribonucleoprotein protein MPP10 n=1 Tax=Golovinomyces cichoracearum TaxID=62708 RepID=A0A420ILA2_9PEZI|nr:U3 small nucleolar RNA-associated protein MPP10 [Golovinomyces cichoracearum]
MTVTSSDSSLTTTSHTMTACPPLSNSSLTTGASGPTLCEILAPHHRHLFITPTSAFSELSLGLAKDILDKSAGNLVDAQTERLKQIREQKKRKRKIARPDLDLQVSKIRKIYTQGFAIENIWEQARRVIDALREDVEKNIDKINQTVASSGEETLGNLISNTDDKNQIQVESGDSSDEQEDTVSYEDYMSENSSCVEEDAELDSEDNGNSENIAKDSPENLTSDEDNQGQEEDEDNEKTDKFYREDPHGLNDGFFSIDEFNKQTELLELNETSAEQFLEEDDEEDIDWDADPMSIQTKIASSGSRSAALNADKSQEDDGPTFGNMDLNAPSGESDEESETETNKDINLGLDNANDIMYNDFFEPAPRKAGKAERQVKFLERQERASKKLELATEEPSLERTISDVKRDLFDDESTHGDSEDVLSESNPSDPKSRKSNHERKQAKIIEEIRRLEAASVASREWTLAGEARANDRPLNSLLEKDLDFERTGKPVPEVTAEVSESIEELIKRRILSQEFDEVIRRRPDDLSKTNVRRGLFELDDNKPQQSLAEIYAEEHIKTTNPNTYISKLDEKVQKEEREIEVLWKEVCGKLDALSSWHFKPKPATPSLTVVSDVATVTIEDAQPTMASGIAGSESMLAPQEIYRAGKEKNSVEKGDIVLSSGIPIARQEMTREQKIRRRRREKERISKRGGIGKNQTLKSNKPKDAQNTLKDLKKGGVKFISNKGDLRDFEGNKIEQKSGLSGASNFKL